MTDLIDIAETAALGPGALIWNAAKPFVIRGALIAALVSGSFIAGCEYDVRANLKAAVKDNKAQVTGVVNSHNGQVAKTITVYKEDLTHVRALEAKNDALQNRNDYLKGLVNNYVPQSPNGPGPYLSPCLVRLLNTAGDNAGDVTDAMASAAVFDCQDAVTGTLTWGEFVRYEIKFRGQYNTWRNKHNELIDEIDKHVVEQALKDATVATKTSPTP